MRQLGLAALVVAASMPAVRAQTQCSPPSIVAGDSSAALHVRYRARFESGVLGAGNASVASNSADVPPHEFRFDLGYDAAERLIARTAVVSAVPESATPALGSFRTVRAAHSIGNQLVIDDDGCQYLGASPDHRALGNPLAALSTGGSMSAGLAVRSLDVFTGQGSVARIGTDRARVTMRIEGEIDADLVREYRLQSGGWTLARAEIRTSSRTRAGGRTEYFTHTSVHDFTLLAHAANAPNEARRAVAPLAPAPSSERPAPPRFDLQSLIPAPPVLRRAAAPGQNLVLMHGIFSSADSWERMEGWLAPRYQLGQTFIPSLASIDRLDAQKDALATLVDLTGARDNILIGHSNGGLVSRALAQARPDLVRGVITNSTLHNGAILATALRTEAGRALGAIAAHLGAGCSSSSPSVGCFLAGVVQDPLVNLAIANFAFDTTLPVTRDMQPDSAFIRRINATGEPFPKVSIENVADARWVAFRLVGDALCNPEAACGGRAWVKYVNSVYVALRACVPTALALGMLDPASARQHAAVAAYCSHVAGALDALDDYWNKLYANGEGGDGIVNTGAQRWMGATAVRIANADSHVGVTRSDKVRDKLFAVLDQQFQVPRRIDPASAATMVSAASYARDSIAPESIVSIFGANLANATEQAAAVPLPTRLGGARIELRDARGVVRPLGLFYASATQVNAAVPAGTAAGLASFTLRTDDGVVRNGAVNVVPVAPGVFTLNASGSGVPAGYALRVRGGVQSSEPIDVPIDLGAASDAVYLVLFGTGLRQRSEPARVLVQVGGIAHPVAYAGAQGMIGLDQINILLSRELIGRGEVDLRVSVDGIAANTTRVAFK